MGTGLCVKQPGGIETNPEDWNSMKAVKWLPEVVCAVFLLTNRAWSFRSILVELS